jgi:hypothetical protein
MKADRPTADGAERTDARPDFQGRTDAPLPDAREGPQQTYDELAQAVSEDRAKNPRRVFARPSEGTDGDEGQSQPTDKWSDPETTSKRIDELKSEGHGPQRHLEVTERNLQDRLGSVSRDANGAVVVNPRNGELRKQPGTQIDPETGTAADAVTGRQHFCGPYATRFDEATDYARADEVLRERAVRTGKLVQREAIAVVFPGGEDRFTGFYQDRVMPENADGSPRFNDIDFTGGKIVALYEERDDGTLCLKTMYPDPDRTIN